MLRAVFLGDIHSGSRVGIVNPDNVTLRDSGEKVRESLWNIWSHEAVSDWHQPDVLVVNGDAIDGPNAKESGFGTVTADVLEQISYAEEAIKLWDARHIIVLRGSKYHVDKGGLQCEELLARSLGADTWPNQDGVKTPDHSGWHLYLTLENVSFHIQHYVPVSKVWHYRTTPLSREMLFSVLNDGLRKVALQQNNKKRTRVTIRSHAHYFCHVEYSWTQGFILPCWQGLSPFMESRSPISISPDIGYVGCTIDDSRFTYESRTWNLESVQPPPHISYSKEVSS